MNLSRNGKWGIVAVAAIALAAAGAALAATRIHTGTSTNGRFGGGPPPGLGGHGFDRDGDHRGGFRGPGGDLAAAASYLGVSTSALLQDLQGGKTLAQVANATSGKSASGLSDALVAAAEKRFGGSAPSTAQLKARITAMVNGIGFGRRGFEGPPQAPPSAAPPTHI